MPAADAAYITASHWADRHARKDHIDWIATEQAHQAYHAAQWDTAQRLLAGVDSSNQHTYSAVRSTRGRIALARGRTEDALTDAGAIIGYATAANNDDTFYDGIALEGLCHVAAGRDAEALAACERFLGRWQRLRGLHRPLNRAVRDHTDPRHRGPPPGDSRRGAAPARSKPLARRTLTRRRAALRRRRRPLRADRQPTPRRRRAPPGRSTGGRSRPARRSPDPRRGGASLRREDRRLPLSHPRTAVLRAQRVGLVLSDREGMRNVVSGLDSSWLP